MSIIDMKQKRTKLVAECDALISNGMSKDDQALFDAALEEANRLDDEIRAAEAGRKVTEFRGRGDDTHKIPDPSGLGSVGADRGDQYLTVDDGGTPTRSWVKDLMAAAQGDAEAREAMDKHTRAINDRERRAGLLAYTAGAGQEAAGPILTDLGLGAILPPTSGKPYLDSLGVTPVPVGIGGELRVPTFTTASSFAEVAEGSAISFVDWVSAVKTLLIGTIAGGVSLSVQYAELAPAFANLAIARDIKAKYEAACETAAVTGATVSMVGLQNIASIGTIAATGTDPSLLYKSILEAMRKVADAGSFVDPDLIVLNNLQWQTLCASNTASDTTGYIRARYPESTSYNGLVSANGKNIGEVGTFAGCKVVCTPAALVENTDEYRVYVLNRQYGHTFFGMPIRFKYAQQVAVSTLSAKVVGYGYFSQYSPHPASVCQITGENTEAVAQTS